MSTPAKSNQATAKATVSKPTQSNRNASDDTKTTTNISLTDEKSSNWGEEDLDKKAQENKLTVIKASNFKANAEEKWKEIQKTLLTALPVQYMYHSTSNENKVKIINAKKLEARKADSEKYDAALQFIGIPVVFFMITKWYQGKNNPVPANNPRALPPSAQYPRGLKYGTIVPRVSITFEDAPNIRGSKFYFINFTVTGKAIQTHVLVLRPDQEEKYGAFCESAFYLLPADNNLLWFDSNENTWKYSHQCTYEQNLEPYPRLNWLNVVFIDDIILSQGRGLDTADWDTAKIQ